MAPQETQVTWRVTIALEHWAYGQGDPAIARALLDRQAAAEWRQRFLAEQVQNRAENGRPVAEVQSVDLRGDLAMVQLRVTDPRKPLPYREARFYRRTDAGWLRTAPDPELWGAEQQRESAYFAFHFRRRDLAAVVEAASRLDELYLHMRRSLGLPDPSTEEKVTVQVVTAEVRRTAWQAKNPLAVTSPLLLPLPMTLSDAEALAQSIALPLGERVLDEALKQIPRRHWQPSSAILNGLRLWQVWDSRGPLAAGRSDLVQWLCRDSWAGRETLSDNDQRLRQMYGIWGFSPLDAILPWLGTALGRELIAAYPPPDRLSYLAVPVVDAYEVEVDNPVEHRGRTIAIATLFEYAVQTYGREHLPALLAAFDEHRRWQTLIPAVFGVSATEFEAGWQAYLVDEYGVGVA